MWKCAVTIAVAICISGCVSNPYTLLPAGPTQVGTLTLDVSGSWNALTVDTSGGPPRASWTHDGPLLDRLLIFADVGDGETLFKERKKSEALPRFDAKMLPNELVSFTEAYLGKMFGEGQALVESGNLRPQAYGGNKGIRFEVTISPSEMAYYKSTVGAFIAGEKLYLMLYIAAEPYYYEKFLAAALDTMATARL
jgi:hypothetical protein